MEGIDLRRDADGENRMHQKVVMPAERLMWIDMATVQALGTAPWLFIL
jgi:hypothetical protein